MIVGTEDSIPINHLTDGSHKRVLRSCDARGKKDWIKYYKISIVLTKAVPRGIQRLRYDEVVYYIDGDKTNNSWDNLVVCSRTEHAKFHVSLEAAEMKAVQAGIITFKNGEYVLQ